VQKTLPATHERTRLDSPGQSTQAAMALRAQKRHSPGMMSDRGAAWLGRLARIDLDQMLTLAALFDLGH